MKTIEEKAKAYDDALERAKAFEMPEYKNIMESVFPELKESENETIKKDLIAWFEEFPDMIWRGHYKKDILAWLEKQSEKLQGKSALEAIKEEKADNQNCINHSEDDEPKFHPGDWIVDNEYGDVLKVDKAHANSYEITTQDGEVFGILKEDVECNHRLWTIEDAEDGDVLATSAGAFIYNGNNGGGGSPGSYCGINTLGRFQLGSETHWARKKVYPATKEQRELLFQKMKEAGYEWDNEKKGLKTIEQKSADKVETKFKEGDYIVSNIDNFLEIWRVINIDKYGYYNIQCINNPEYDEIYRVPGFVLEQDYRRWTIQDARDGDVLVIQKTNVTYETIFIFNKIENNRIIQYLHYFTTDADEEVCEARSIDGFLGFVGTTVHPATKEQCDLLFQKMKEAGYEWNSEKRELKKIEQKPADKIEPKFHEDEWIISDTVDKDYHICKITDIKDGNYTIESIYGYKGYNQFDVFDNAYRLWDVTKDAKDGDVLSYVTDEEDLWIMIYRSLYEPYEGHVHYHALLVNDNFSDKGTCCICIDNLKPATKEQQELLFQKMKETGYEWDSDKKELKKIEVVSKESEDKKIKKELIAFIKKRDKSGCDYDYDKWIAWLEKQGHMLDPDKVIEWIDDQACQGWIEDIEVDKFVDKFKRHFGL